MIVRVYQNLNEPDKIDVSILHDLIPFDVISTIAVEGNDTFMPVNDTRAIAQRNKLSFLAITRYQLVRFVSDQSKWSVESKKGQLNDAAISSFILTNEDVLIALKRSYSFFSPDLDPILELTLDYFAHGLERNT